MYVQVCTRYKVLVQGYLIQATRLLLELPTCMYAISYEYLVQYHGAPTNLPKPLLGPLILGYCLLGVSVKVFYLEGEGAALKDGAGHEARLLCVVARLWVPVMDHVPCTIHDRLDVLRIEVGLDDRKIHGNTRNNVGPDAVKCLRLHQPLMRIVVTQRDPPSSPSLRQHP